MDFCSRTARANPGEHRLRFQVATLICMELTFVLKYFYRREAIRVFLASRPKWRFCGSILVAYGLRQSADVVPSG